MDNGTPCEGAKLLGSRVGNAFSAYAVGPIAITALSIAGLGPDDFPGIDSAGDSQQPDEDISEDSE